MNGSLIPVFGPGIVRPSLHELPTLKCRNIGRVKFEPLAVPAFRVKPAVPVHLNPFGVVSPDLVDYPRLFRQLNSQFPLPASNRVRPSDLVGAARAKKVDKSALRFGFCLGACGRSISLL